PSVARYVNWSTPWKPGAGVYWNDPSARKESSVPCWGCVSDGVTAESGSASGSVSLASTPGAGTTRVWPTPVVYESSTTAGGWPAARAGTPAHVATTSTATIKPRAAVRMVLPGGDTRRRRRRRRGADRRFGGRLRI